MRILYVSTCYPPSIAGAQIHLHHLSKAMKEAGDEVSVVSHWSRNRTDWLRGTTFLSDSAKHYQHEGVSVSRLGFSRSTRIAMFPWAVLYYFLMKKSIQKISGYMMPYFEDVAGEPSLVHATRIGREFIVRTSLDFARQRGIPFVLTPNHHPRWRSYPYYEYDKIYREADAVIALTRAEKETLVAEKGVTEEKVHITGIGPILSDKYSAGDFRAKYNLEEKFVLYLGRQCKYKGVEAILKAANIVWQKQPKVKFVFVGPHTNDSRKLFKGFHDPRIVNLGTVDIETKTSALAACEFLCMPSSQESFGGVYVEAWSLHKAVIGGRIPPIASVIDEGQDGLLSSQDPDELAERILSLLSCPSKCQAMGDAGFQKVQTEYTWQGIAKKIRMIYESLGS